MGLCWRTVDLFLAGDSRAEQAHQELRERAEGAGCEAYRLQKVLVEADRRWRESTIAALARWYPRDVQVSVGTSLQPDYPPSLVLQSGEDFVRALTDAYHNLPAIVIEMLVDQGYMTPEQAERQLRKLAEKQREAAEK